MIMPDLPRRKVGLLSCSGEEIVEGTVARVATRLVLEKLRPEDTVTLCLPLFLAGDEGERAFARHYPVIAIDGCDKLCATRATEKYSGPVADVIVISELMENYSDFVPDSRRDLGQKGQVLTEVIAREIAACANALLRSVRKGEVRGESAPCCDDQPPEKPCCSPPPAEER
jgi:uncharacterized metal-binding protein